MRPWRTQRGVRLLGRVRSRCSRQFRSRQPSANGAATPAPTAPPEACFVAFFDLATDRLRRRATTPLLWSSSGLPAWSSETAVPTSTRRMCLGELEPGRLSGRSATVEATADQHSKREVEEHGGASELPIKPHPDRIQTTSWMPMCQPGPMVIWACSPFPASKEIARLVVGQRGREGPTDDGKIKAARCAAVGRAGAEDASTAWREAYRKGTAFLFAQLRGIPSPLTPRDVHAYDR
jgi:hypothetical protein